MKILILGGSGILSTDFTHLCLDNNNMVCIVNRGKKNNVYRFSRKTNCCRFTCEYY